MNPRLFLTLLFLTSAACVSGQGCVAIKHFSPCTPTYGQTSSSTAGEFMFSLNYRYFRSFRHFRGTEEEPDRLTDNTEVINHQHSFDYQITYGLNDRWQFSLTLPFVINTRSSLYEHGRNERHTTFSRGLGDVTVGANYWLIAPLKNTSFNAQMGAGIKLPTGSYNATDIFYNVGPEGGPEIRPVDQSIQPGDGGFGVLVQGQAYYVIGEKAGLFASGFYLFNPRGTNGTRTFRETLSPVLENEAIMAVPDQFSAQLGLSYLLSQSLSLMGGLRYEGIPVEDVFGSKDGFRRPGNILSVEPGINFMKGRWNLNLTVPFAVRRDRPQSVTDLETEIQTGEPRNGDAAFADYLINVGITFRVPAKSSAFVPE